MILNRKYYNNISYLKAWWYSWQLKKIAGEKLFKAFKLHKTEWPNKLYFYSPRLKRRPVFTAGDAKLSNWKELKLCETICPTQAIRVTASAFTIDDRGCIGCGLCVEVAPPGMLKMSSDSPSKYVGLERN
jgi:ferredoxin